MLEVAEVNQDSRFKWVILFASFCAFVAYAFALQVAPSLFDSIMREFKITNAEAGLLMSVVLLPGILLSLPAGMLVARYGVRRLGIASLACVVLGPLVTATADSFVMMLAGRFTLGVGGTFVVTTAPALIAQWFDRKELGKAMGIFGVNMPVATVAAFPFAAVTVLSRGWRFPFYVSSAVGMTAAAIFVMVVKEGPLAQHRSRENIGQGMRSLEMWKVGLVWLFFNAAALSFTTWGPTLFVRYRNITAVQASFLASLLMWIAIFCVPFYGFLSDRIGRRRPFAILGMILMALAFVGLALAGDLGLIALVLALGVTAAMVPPVVSALPPEVLGLSLASIGFGVIGICLNTGASLAPPLIGLLLDSTKSYALCLLGMAALSATGAAVAYTMKTK